MHSLPSPALCPRGVHRRPAKGRFRRDGPGDGENLLHPGPAQARSWPAMQPHGHSGERRRGRRGCPRCGSSTDASGGAPAGQFPQPRERVVNDNQSCRRPGQHQPGDSWAARVKTFRDTVPGDGGQRQEADLGPGRQRECKFALAPPQARQRVLGIRGCQSHNPGPAAMSQNTGGTPVIRLRALASLRATT